MRKIKHGLSYTKAYKAWSDAKARCFNPESSEYKRYGAIGISMDLELINDPVLWCKTLGDPPCTEELPSRYWSVDRINPFGNYSVDNIKWSSASEQVQNRKRNSNNTSGFSGICFKIDKNNKTRVCVYWSDKGKSYGKSFNASRLGIIQATKLAVQFRDNKIAELNLNGSSYSKYHGKETYETKY